MGIRDLLIERFLLRRIVSLGKRGPAPQDLSFAQLTMAFRASRGAVPRLAGWVSVQTVLGWSWYMLSTPFLGLLGVSVNFYAITILGFSIAILSTVLDALSRILLRIRIGLHLIGRTPCAQCGYETTDLMPDSKCPECGQLLSTQCRLLKKGILEVFAWPWLARFANDHAPRAGVRIGRRFATARASRAMVLRLLLVMVATAGAMVGAKFLAESVNWMRDVEPNEALGGAILIVVGVAGLVCITLRPRLIAQRAARRLAARHAQRLTSKSALIVRANRPDNGSA